MLLPLPFSIYYGDSDVMPIIYSAVITMCFGAASLIIPKKKADLRPKEGFAVVTFGWIILSAFGSLPFLLSGSIASPTDAFFETMSGFTTTGSTILTDIEALPHGILFWRSLTHWIGGMGIIVLSIAILPFLGVGGMQLFKAEVPGPIADKLTPRVTETAKILWGVYLIFTIIETGLLMFGGMTLFDALCHSFGTMATGGFSTKNASVGGYNSPFIDYVIIIFMFIAGTNFSLHYKLFRGKIREYWSSHEFRVFVYIVLAATFVISIDVYINMASSVEKSFRDTLFQVLAIITTTGFGSADYEKWSTSSQIILMILMFVGGMAGSTGGGIKVIRIYILAKFVFSEIVRLLHPQAIVSVKIGKTTIDRKTIMNIAGFFAVYMFITISSVLAMSFLGLELDTSIGTVIATINNIGPGIGTVGPTENFAHIPDIGKWLLSFLMLVGRLEVFTVIILLAPSFWRK